MQNFQAKSDTHVVLRNLDSMIDVVPAILPEDFEDLEDHMTRVRGHVDRVQIDIANGSYAPSTTWPFSSNEHFADLISEEEGLPFWRDLDVELDLLVLEPEKYIDDWMHIGIAGAIIHIGSTDKYKEVADKLKDNQIELGWGMKPNTESDELEKVINEAGVPDFIQVMGSDKIGYHEVELDKRVYDKVVMIREKYPDMKIAVDIGVNFDTAPKLVEIGVNKLVSGSAIFKGSDIEDSIEYFQNLA